MKTIVPIVAFAVLAASAMLGSPFPAEAASCGGLNQKHGFNDLLSSAIVWRSQ